MKDGIYSILQIEGDNMLDQKFKHSRWYKGSQLTIKQFLELAAEDSEFGLEKIASKKHIDYLFEPITYKIILKNEEGGSYNISNEEIDYFNLRREFWNRWHKTFADNNFNGHYDIKYIEKENVAKMAIPEYAEAYNQLKFNVTR